MRDYVENGSVDEALELTVRPAAELDAADQERVLSTFFDASWHNQIFVHPRYRELFLQRAERRPFSMEDIQDLQAWFNLAWFGKTDDQAAGSTAPPRTEEEECAP